MIDAYKQFWLRALDFSGRSDRPQFWWPYLFNTIISVVLSLAYIGAAASGGGEGSPGGGFVAVSVLLAIWSLALLVPQLAVSVRRLHDTDLSGWFILLGFVPFVGGLILLFLFVRPTVWQTNAWGVPGQ